MIFMCLFHYKLNGALVLSSLDFHKVYYHSLMVQVCSFGKDMILIEKKVICKSFALVK